MLVTLYSLKASIPKEVLDQIIDADIRKLFQSDLFMPSDLLSDCNQQSKNMLR